MLKGFPNRNLQLLHREGFDEVIQSPGLHTFHSIFDGAVSGYHYHIGVDVGRPELFHKRQAIEPGKPHIRNHKVVGLYPASLKGLSAVLAVINFVAVGSYGFGVNFPDHFIVVDHEDVRSILRPFDEPVGSW